MIKNKKALTVVYLVLTIALTVFIFSNSLDNGEESGKKSDFVVDCFTSLLGWFGIEADEYVLGVIIRKLAHFTEYFVLGVTSSLFVINILCKRHIYISPAYCLLTAFCDEFVMQMMTDGRAPRFTDVLIDFSGVLLAVGLVCFFRLRKEK